jgi:hypothetical protein
LYICKELVTRQGGHMQVKRRSEKGTTFSFTLPVASLDNAIAPATYPEEPIRSQIISPGV